MENDYNNIGKKHFYNFMAIQPNTHILYAMILNYEKLRK